VKGTFRQISEDKKKGVINPIVKICGNLLLASVFEALILRAVEECSRSYNHNQLDGGMSEKLMKSFGIDAFQLRNYRSYKEKRDYLINMMTQMIDKLLRNWKEKIEIREKNFEVLDMKSEKTNEMLENSFSFLKLKTKYQALRKKLTTTVVQKLNDVIIFSIFSNFLFF
jgi:CRISPR/Cas system-associated protein Csx1